MTRLRHSMVYLGFRLGAGLLGLLPIRLAQLLGQLGGRLTYLFAAGRREMALRHARRLGAPDPRRQALRMFGAYGRYWAEAFWVRPRRLPSIEAATRIEGLEHITEAMDRGTGMVLALPHIGNWEIAGPVAGRLGLHLVAVAEDLANRRIRDWFLRLRNALGIDIVLRSGHSVMRQLEETVSGNGAVALLCDRDLRSKGISVTFFGEETTLPAGPVSLAVRTGAPLIPVASYFLPDGGHRVVVRPPIELPPGTDKKARVSDGTQRLAVVLEELIREAPDQWHLLQPNWPSDTGAGDR